MKILVTGGLGYIGSHTCVELLEKNYELVIVDNLYNSKIEVLDKIEKIGKVRPKFYQIDLTDKEKVDEVFKEEKDIEAVIHFAGLKAVGESVDKPIKYYSNNLISTLNLLEIMQKYNVKKFIFSSSATVYGEQQVPYTETMHRGETTNPYGTTKAMIEKMLEDLYASDNTWDISILRYFNPVGAHESGLLGENPNGIPNNLMPYVMKVASGELECLSVFGNDYPTKDGTGVRDYIHVVDLAKGHVKTLEKLNNEKSGLFLYNLGTGTGYSVLDIVNNFKKVNNIDVKYKIVGRRSGDIATCYADPTKAKKELGWSATKTLEDMCKDSWNFQKNQK